MVPIGFAVLWLGYGVTFTGWCWVKGYNVPVRQIWSPLNWYKGPWPPDQAPNTVLIPGTASTGTAGGGGGVPPEGIKKPGKSGSCPPGYVKFMGVCLPPLASRTAT